MPPHTSESPAKKQSKWSPEEDALIIELRGTGMKWDDISKRLPGRSSISCRLHYQNYLERRSEWDEERKNKLARLYERFKPEMWAKVAEEMQVPWRAAEAMHWQLGEVEMARRAGVVPFSTNMTMNEPQGPQRISPTRGHAHSQSQGSLPRNLTGLPSPRYTRGPPPLNIPPLLIPPPTPTTTTAGSRSRRESLPPRHAFGPPLSDQLLQSDYASGYGLAPIQQQQQQHSPHTTTTPVLGRDRGGSTSGGGMLPSVAELTTGVSPYPTPAYTIAPPPPNTTSPSGSGGGGGGSGSGSGLGSSSSLLPALSPYPPPPPGGHLEPAAAGKRRASPPDAGASRETSRRRHLLHHRNNNHQHHHHPRGMVGMEEYSPQPQHQQQQQQQLSPSSGGPSLSLPPPPPPPPPPPAPPSSLFGMMGVGGGGGMGTAAAVPTRRGTAGAGRHGS
ncbi:snRNA-activating protein complex subunit 4 [Chaetomidium leptoderma]|uniref:snRNA-activating protein complex subunit 4 n=1 Tax=Chaetomidium leptoderma TaxID=669021 RepID=A0AAN6VTN0_9PEZI|nr:snRNA-activating protein complex subunit 4 [Chaetomidium leptoderma]